MWMGLFCCGTELLDVCLTQTEIIFFQVNYDDDAFSGVILLLILT